MAPPIFVPYVSSEPPQVYAGAAPSGAAVARVSVMNPWERRAMWIFLLLVAVPAIEIGLFVEIGGRIGLWPTLGTVVLTAVLGAALLRAQGFAAMARLQKSLAEGGDPRGPLADGVMILVAGLLMLTPGFFTDAIGFVLLVPPARRALLAWAGPRLAARVVYSRGGAAAGRGGPTGPSRGGGEPGGGPIDVEYEDLTDGPTREGGSGWSKRPGD